MNESDFWRYLNKNMKVYWWAIRVENSVIPGTPDLWYASRFNNNAGWIELKYLKKYPRKLYIRHFTKEQKHILKRIDQYSTSFLFIKIVNDYYLIKGDDSNKITGMTIEELKNISYAVWYRSIDFKNLAEIL